MNRKLLITSIALIVIGALGRMYAASYTYVSEDGVLHDSFWLPLGTFMFLIGAVLLVALGAKYAMTALKK